MSSWVSEKWVLVEKLWTTTKSGLTSLDKSQDHTGAKFRCLHEQFSDVLNSVGRLSVRYEEKLFPNFTELTWAKVQIHEAISLFLWRKKYQQGPNRIILL